jgi:hypothetical protein
MPPLAGNVAIDGVWYGPAYPDVPVPPEVAVQIGEHAWVDGVRDGVPDPEPDGEGEPGGSPEPSVAPPTSGPGSSTEAWAAYAVSVGVEVPDGASRSDVFDLLRAAGVQVDQ